MTALERAEIAAWSSLYDAAPPALAERMGFAHERVDGATVFRARLPLPLFNRMLGMDAIRDAHVAALAPGMYLQAPPPLVAEARARGLVPRAAWLKLQRGAAPPAPGAGAIAVVEADAGLAETFARTFCLAYDLPLALAPWHAALVGRPGWHAYVGFAGDAAIATATLFLDGPVAWLGGAGTLPAHRGRGAQRTLIARRVADAIAAGATALVSETGAPPPGAKNPSLDNLLAAGFTVAYERVNFVRP